MRRQMGEPILMVRAFDDHLMGADTVHPVIETFPLLVEISLDDQGRIFIGHNTEFPAGGVGVSPLPAVDQHLVRGCFSLPGTERAEAALDLVFLHQKIGRPLAPFLGNNNPTAENRVFT
jgi:hypothetical protein